MDREKEQRLYKVIHIAVKDLISIGYSEEAARNEVYSWILIWENNQLIH